MPCEFGELKKFTEDLGKLKEEYRTEFLQSSVKLLSAMLLAKVINRTPVGKYNANTGMIGGTLRRGWTGGVSQDVVQYVNSLKIERSMDAYKISIINPVVYAPYVEYGHRQMPGRFVPALGKKLKQGWVEGKFMLTISEKEIQASGPSVLEKKLEKFLKEGIHAE